MSETLWSAPEAAAATGGRLLNGEAWRAGGVSIDTRFLEPGDLFVALKDARDGHDFLAQAFVSGASAALISDSEKAEGLGPALVVPDVLEGLRKLGEAARERSGAKRIAITGSVGKTSTKEALALCLAATGATHRSLKSYNNHWGVPLTLARMPAASQFAVFEIGMNHRGEIAPLAHLVRPHAALGDQYCAGACGKPRLAGSDRRREGRYLLPAWSRAGRRWCPMRRRTRRV